MAPGYPLGTIRLLVVEDDRNSVDFLSAVLTRGNGAPSFQLHVAHTLADALALVADAAVDAVLLDLDLPDSTGLSTVTAMLRACNLPIVVLTASDDDGLSTQAVEAGAQDYLVKGANIAHQLVRAIVHAMERHLRRRQLEMSEQRFRDFAEVSSDWFWETDPELRFSWVSDHVRHVLGVDPVDMVGTPYETVMVSDDGFGRVATHRYGLERREAFRNFTFQPVNAPGRRIRVCGKPVFSGSGKFLGYRGIGTDVTEEIEAQVFAASMLAVLMDSLAAFPSGIMIFDAADCLLLANEQAGSLLPCCVAQLIAGTPFIDILAQAGQNGALHVREDGFDAWLEDWRSLKASQEGTFAELTPAGPALYFHQYRTGAGGMLRIVRPERRAIG